MKSAFEFAPFNSLPCWVGASNFLLTFCDTVRKKEIKITFHSKCFGVLFYIPELIYTLLCLDIECFFIKLDIYIK